MRCIPELRDIGLSGYLYASGSGLTSGPDDADLTVLIYGNPVVAGKPWRAHVAVMVHTACKLSLLAGKMHPAMQFRPAAPFLKVCES